MLICFKSVLRGLKVQIENMIKTPKTAIAPTEELAKLILGGVGSTETRLSSPAIEASSFHVLGEIDGAPVLGPPGPPMETPKVITEHPLNEPTVTVTAQDVEMNEISPGDDRVTETDTTQQSDDQSENVTPSQPEQPTRAPPVPPRPSPAAESQVRVNIDIHKQQDVSEVLHDVLFRAQCALKKMGMYVNDSSQADKITE